MAFHLICMLDRFLLLFLVNLFFWLIVGSILCWRTFSEQNLHWLIGLLDFMNRDQFVILQKFVLVLESISEFLLFITLNQNSSFQQEL